MMARAKIIRAGVDQDPRRMNREDRLDLESRVEAVVEAVLARRMASKLGAPDLSETLAPDAVPQRAVHTPHSAVFPTEDGARDGDEAFWTPGDPNVTYLLRYAQSRRQGERWQPIAALAAPVVTSFPANPVAGQMVRYRHTAGRVPWLCVWDPDLNSGAGAWHVVSAPEPLSAQQTASSSMSGSTAFQVMTNGPRIQVPIAGRYMIEGGGSVAMDNVPGGIIDWAVQFAYGTTSAAGTNPLADLGRGTLPNAAWQGRHSLYRKHRQPETLATNLWINLRVQASNASAGMRWGDYTPWTLMLTPVELRP